MSSWNPRKVFALAGMVVALVFPMNSRIELAIAQDSLPESLATPQNPEDLISEQLDNIADRIFYEKHPELDGRKILPSETDLAEEWEHIRRCDAVVDYNFYQRHPELGGRKIRVSETDLAQEWLEISNTISGC